MDELTTTEGIAALAAGGVAFVALVLGVVLAFKVRRMRTGLRTVLGDSGERDLVSHAAELQGAFVQLRDWVEDTARGLERRMAGAEERIDGCVTYRSLVRYDAYGEMSGRQSSSVALLDSHRSGVVISSILHREQARVYVKQIRGGESELELSPEEREAIDRALTAGPEAEDEPATRASA